MRPSITNNALTFTKFQFFRINLEQTREENANSWQSFFTTTDNLIYIYSSIAILFVILALATSYTFNKLCLRASNNLHNKMFSKIVYAPMLFFNTNCSGRILNRFSKDMGAVDEILPLTLGDAMEVSECQYKWLRVPREPKQ